MMMRLLRMIVWGVCLLPLAMGGQSADWHAGAKPAPAKNGDAKSARADEDWPRVKQFMSVHCKNRWRVFEAMGEGPHQKEAAHLFSKEYRQIERHGHDPALQDAMIHEAEAQDSIFGAQVELRKARRDTPAWEQAKTSLRNAVGLLIKARADRLRAASDHLINHRDVLVNEWTESLIRGVHPIASEVGSGSESGASPGTETESPGVR